MCAQASLGFGQRAAIEYQAGPRRVVVPFHAGVTLHPKAIKEVLDAIAEFSATTEERD